MFVKKMNLDIDAQTCRTKLESMRIRAMWQTISEKKKNRNTLKAYEHSGVSNIIRQSGAYILVIDTVNLQSFGNASKRQSQLYLLNIFTM
jgi:hypothetical protein